MESKNTETGISTQEKIQDMFFLETETIHAGIREMRINATLNKARDIETDKRIIFQGDFFNINFE